MYHVPIIVMFTLDGGSVFPTLLMFDLALFLILCTASAFITLLFEIHLEMQIT